MTEETKQYPVLAIGLSKAALAVIRSSLEGLAVTALSFNDATKGQAPAALFTEWDGKSGEALKLLRKAKTSFPRIPLYLLFKSDEKAEKERFMTTRQVKVTAVFTYPHDSAKITAALADIFLAEAEESSAPQRQQPAHPDVAKASRPPQASPKQKEKKAGPSSATPALNAQKISEMTSIDDRVVINKITEQFSPFLLAQNHEEQIDVTTISSSDIIFYHSDEDELTQAVKMFRGYGFPKMVGITDVSTVLTHVRHGRTAGLFIWCHHQLFLTAHLIQEIVEMRDLGRINIFLVVASQDVAQRFLAKYGSYCPVDGVILKNEPKQTLVPKLWKLWAHQIPNQKAIDTFHELRLRWRSSRCRHRKQLRADEFDELYNSLAGFSLGYYKTVEKFYEAATQGRISEMGNMVDTIKKAMDVTPDAIIAYAHYIMMNKNSGEAAEFLMEELLPHRLFTVEKAYHAARVLARWGQKEQLKRLMEHWKMRYDFPLRAYYYFSMSLYHRITGDVASQTLCLKKSILFDPLNVDHILALVELYEEKELFETAEQIRLVLKSSDLAAEFNFENEARKAG